MALTQPHITCRYAGSNDTATKPSNALPRKPVWSQTMINTTGKTAKPAPPKDAILGDPIIDVIHPTKAIYVSIGNPPDVTNGPRDYIGANERFQQYVDPGDFVEWVEA